jgi:CRP/FNR family transcriptional regulator, cyclic AMP receptor protein
MATDPEIVSALKNIPWFAELKPEHFTGVVEAANLRYVKAGEELFKEGNKEDCFYVVLEGRVALDIFVPHRGKVRIYTAEAMDLIGWSAITPVVHSRTAGATVVQPGKLAAFNAEKIRHMCEEDHDFGYLFMRRMAHIIAGRLLVTRLQLLDMFADPDSESSHA